MASHISLGWELDELEHALEGARILCDITRHGDHTTVAEERVAPRACSAILTLIHERLRLTRRAIQGLVDPALLVAPHNTRADGEECSDEADVLLPIRLDSRDDH